jgi:hypothetical protein
MVFPSLENPRAYQGLYVIDFGESVSVGYTAAEVGRLLEMERFRDSKVYRIHNAYPDGRMELLGVSATRFLTETGMFFSSGNPEKARADFEVLARLANDGPIPSRAKLQLAELPGSSYPHAVGLIYPAEFDGEWSAWMMRAGYKGGESCDLGAGHVSDWYAHARVSDSIQLLQVLDRPTRSLADLVASVGMPLQRKAG